MFMEFFTPRRLSCGVLILNAERELLLCHVTGQQHWDLPKGGIDRGESPLEAAVRETREETGLLLDGAGLLDLGRCDYRPRKDLHLFAMLMPRLDVTTLHCESQFSDLSSGRRMPEMDDYAWVALSDAPRRCTGRMATVLSERIGLERLWTRLMAAPAPSVAPAVRPVRRPRASVAVALDTP